MEQSVTGQMPDPGADEPRLEQATFEALGLLPEVLNAVRQAGYEHPTPIQAEAIPLVLKGRDLMGLAQTGTGKTAAFTLPIINRLINGPRRTRALVLTPTRELAIQVEESVRKYAADSGLDVIAVFGGVPLEPQQK
jgi:ATP-dependent RNA helicase RhlE